MIDVYSHIIHTVYYKTRAVLVGVKKVCNNFNLLEDEFEKKNRKKKLKKSTD